MTKLTAQWSEMNLRTRREFGMPDAMPAVEEKAGGVYLPIRLWRRGILASIILMLIGGKWVRIGGILFPWAPITWNIDKHCVFGVYGYMCLLLLWKTWTMREEQVVVSMLSFDITGAGDTGGKDMQKGKVASRYGRTIMTGVCFSRGRVINSLPLHTYGPPAQGHTLRSGCAWFLSLW